MRVTFFNMFHVAATLGDSALKSGEVWVATDEDQVTLGWAFYHVRGFKPAPKKRISERSRQAA